MNTYPRSVPHAKHGRVRYSLLTLLTIVTVVCIALGWLYRRQPFVATAYLQVRYQPTENVGAESSYFDKKNEIFCQSQLTLFKSEFVLYAALAPSKVAQLPSILRQQDPVTWLSNSLEVSFPGGGEILEISLAGSEASMPDYCVLIDAVISAYRDEVLSRRRMEFAREHENTGQLTQEIQDELKSKIEEVNSLAKELGETGSNGPQLTLLQAEVDLLTKHWKELQRRMWREDAYMKTSQQSILLMQSAMSRKQ